MASMFVRTLARVSPGGSRRWGRFPIFPKLGKLTTTRTMTTELKDELVAIKDELAKLNTTMTKGNVDMRKAVKEGVIALKEYIKDIKKFLPQSATSLEEEIVLAVCTAFRNMGLEVIDIKYNHEFSDPVTGKTLCVPDGLILLNNGFWALVEVFPWVDVAKLAQVAKMKRALTGLGYRIMYEFVGGPSFAKQGNKGIGMKDEALARGLCVVVVTGEQYEVVFPSPPHPPHLGTMTSTSALNATDTVTQPQTDEVESSNGVRETKLLEG